MTFQQIQYFIAVAQSATYLEAAEKMNISQSSLSKQIISLENELDIQLFDRSHRSAVLNDAGRQFYTDAVKILADYDRMRSNLRPFARGLTGQVRLGTLPILTQYGLTSALHHFSEEYPGIYLNIDEVEDDTLIYGLKHGDYDFAIARQSLVAEENIKSFPLADDELAAVVSVSHPLARREAVDLEELRDEKFILMHKKLAIHQLAVDSCLACGFSPKILRTARIESIISAVSANEGISLLCRKNFNIFNPAGVRILSLEKPVKASVVLAWMAKPRLSQSAAIFLKYIRSMDGCHSCSYPHP